MALEETPGPILFHVIIWTTLTLGLIAVMVVFLLN